MDYGLTRVVEHTVDTGFKGRQDHGVEKRVKACKDQRADNDGDNDLDTGIDIAFGSCVIEGGLYANCKGICLGLDVVKKVLHFAFPHSFCFVVFYLFAVMKSEKDDATAAMTSATTGRTEHILDALGKPRKDRAVEDSVETAEKQCTDDDGNNHLDRCIDIPFSALIVKHGF